jgi:hypothetical protein
MANKRLTREDDAASVNRIKTNTTNCCARRFPASSRSDKQE